MCILRAGAAICALLLVTSLPQTLKAQGSTAQVTGRITDSSEAVVPKARVTVSSVATKTSREVLSNEEGYYTVPLLDPGEYRISVEAAGFQQIIRTGLFLLVNQAARLDFTLQVGEVTQAVEVTATAPLVDRESSALGAVVENRTIVNLPLNGRNPYALALLVPGVTTSGFNLSDQVSNHMAAGQLIISGGRSRTSEFLIDGHVNTANWSEAYSSVAALPSIDAVQEFKVQTNSFSAEFGRSSGGVVNAVIRSGGNAFHGTAYEFLRNSKLDANNFFSNSAGRPLASFKRNQYGFSLGGPIVRDRASFFFNYEALRQRVANTFLGTVPTPAQRAGDFSQLRARLSGNCVPITIYDPSTTRRTADGTGFVRDPFPGNLISPNRFDPVAVNQLKLYPAPNQAGDSCTGLNNFFSAKTDALNIDQIDSRGDWNVTSKDRITLGVSWREFKSRPANHYETLGNTRVEIQDDPTNNSRIAYTRVQSTNLVFDARFNVARAHRAFQPSGSGTDITQIGYSSAVVAQMGKPLQVPPFLINGYSGVGFSCCAFAFLTGTSYNWAGNASWIKSRHGLKFGFDTRVFQSREFTGFSTSGSYFFDRSFTQGPNPNVARADLGDGMASLLLGLGQGTVQSIPDIMTSNQYYAFYVQDDWKVSSKLTVNLGLRYDLEMGRHERFNQLSYLDINAPSPLAARVPQFPNLRGGLRFVGGDVSRQFDTDWNNWGPRVGLSYSVDTQTTIRAGYAIFYPPYIGSASGAGAGFAGFQSSTPWVSTLDGVTPLNRLSNAFPSGLELPPGSSQGLLTLVGTGIGTTGRDGAIIRNARAAYVQQWNFNLQRELPGRIAVEAAYAASKGTKLPYGPLGEELNQLTPEQLSLGASLQQLVPNPFFGVITARGPLSQPMVTRGQLLRPYPHFLELLNFRPAAGNSMYHSLQLRVQKQFSSGVTFLASYTNAKLITDSDGITSFDGNAPGTQNAYDRRADRSLSGMDVSQRLVMSFVAAIPFGKGSRFGATIPGWLNVLAGGWQTNGVVTFQSGFPLAITAPNTSGSFSRGLRPNVAGDPRLDNGRATADKLREWFNTRAFVQPAPFTFGNGPRTLPNVRNDGTNNLDFSLFKVFPVTEKANLEFRAEAFNLTNTPQFANPGTALGNAAFGVVTFQSNAPRQVQFGLKLGF